MRFFKNKIFIGIISVLVITVILGIISTFKNNFLSNILNTAITPIQSGVAKIIMPIKNHITLLDEMKDYRADNERLKREINQLKIQNRDEESYIRENNRLKTLLDLKEKEVNLTTVSAQVISRDYDEWYKGVTINRGKAHGINVSDAVMTADGILGVVDSVGTNWAKVITIYDSNTAVGVRLTRTGDVAVLEGSNDLASVKKCKMEYISDSASIINGDILVTSGLGGVYPAGLMVGKIDEVKIDAMGKIEYAVVKPSVSFDDVYEVLVITDFLEVDPKPTKNDANDRNEQELSGDNGEVGEE